MKISSSRYQAIRMTVCLGCLVAGVNIVDAQPPPKYPAPYYPPPKPSPMDRLRSAGHNVGEFVRRTYYGETAPASYPQKPVYRRPPGGAYQAENYSLDAPARPVAVTSGTGFQRPVSGTTPKYVTPPAAAQRETEQLVEADAVQSSKPASKRTAKAEPKTKSSSSPEAKSAPPAATKKRYTPAKPSTVAKTKTTTVKKHVEDEPPPAPTFKHDEPPTVPEPPKYEKFAPKPPTTEARLNTEFYPLPGSPMDAPTTRDASSVPPRIGGADSDLTPKITESAPAMTKTEPAGTTTDVGSKSSSSFLVGKRTSKAGRVVSPYPPYNELDITGLPSGSLALDPTTQKVFEVP